ncbi:hypothetical protein STEG23_019677 [Scotinomys teguina]
MTGTSPLTKLEVNATAPSSQDHQAASTHLLKSETSGPVTTKLSLTQPATTEPSKEPQVPDSSPMSTSPWPPGPTNNQSAGSSPMPSFSGPQRDKTDTLMPPIGNGSTSSNGPSGSSGGESSDVTTATSILQESDQLTTEASSQSPVPLTTSKPPSASTTDTDSTASPDQAIAAPSRTTESRSTSVPSSPGPVSSSDFSVSPGKPTAHTPPDASKETPPVTSPRPGISTSPLSTPLQPTGSPGGTAMVPTTEEFTRSSSNLTPTAPQGPSTPSPIWTFRDYKLKCDSAIKLDGELLILNLTGASLCEGSPPDEKLVELLCRSVKASFKPAQDQCTLEVAPILQSQAVAVKKVIIETKLSPKDVFELLKDKWDDLREAGVSHMTLGKEGPPEVNEDRFSLPLIITIVCMASFLLLIAALYGCCHQRVSQRKDQQRLTEELQTVENGYHDNPTLEVMETPSEMQEKKVVNLNGELGDSWIVPLDNLTKDDLDEEEDTHL